MEEINHFILLANVGFCKCWVCSFIGYNKYTRKGLRSKIKWPDESSIRNGQCQKINQQPSPVLVYKITGN